MSDFLFRSHLNFMRCCYVGNMYGTSTSTELAVLILSFHNINFVLSESALYFWLGLPAICVYSSPSSLCSTAFLEAVISTDFSCVLH